MANKQTSAETLVLDEDDVVAYLRANPGFFDEHPELLARMKLFHDSGRAVSLIERQVEKLRDDNQKLSRKLQQLVDVARDNQKLGARMQKLAIAVLDSQSLAELLAAVEDSFRDDFDAEQVAVKLLDKPQYGLSALPARHRAAPDGELAGSFRMFLQHRRVRCGRLLEDQCRLLFGREAEAIGSVAMVPLFGGDEFGLLALGSRNPAHFQPGMGVHFLEQIGELLSAALKVRFERR